MLCWPLSVKLYITSLLATVTVATVGDESRGATWTGPALAPTETLTMAMVRIGQFVMKNATMFKVFQGFAPMCTGIRRPRRPIMKSNRLKKKKKKTLWERHL